MESKKDNITPKAIVFLPETKEVLVSNEYQLNTDNLTITKLSEYKGNGAELISKKFDMKCDLFAKFPEGDELLYNDIVITDIGTICSIATNLVLRYFEKSAFQCVKQLFSAIKGFEDGK